MKNNEIETCEKLGRNRILEVEIKINICKILAKHDKAFFGHENLNYGKHDIHFTLKSQSRIILFPSQARIQVKNFSS